MRLFVLIGLLAHGLATLCFAVNTPFPARCEARIIANASVQTPIPRYRQNYWRQAPEYFDLLGGGFEDDFRSRLRSVGANATPHFLDLGAGLSLTGIHWAEHGGKAIALSAQDFWGQWDQLAALHTKDIRLSTFGKEWWIDSLNGIDPSSLKAVATCFSVPFDGTIPLRARRFMGFPLGPSPQIEVLKQNLQTLSNNVRLRRVRLEEAGRFQREVGLAEHKLRDWDGRVDLLADVYGAFFYSLDRRHILELVYASLKENGTAYLLYHRRERSRYGGPFDVVQHDGAESDFVDYLIARFPTIFSEFSPVEGLHSSRVLILKRDPHIPSLRLPLVLHTNSVQYVSSTDGYSFPQRVIYTPHD